MTRTPEPTTIILAAGRSRRFEAGNKLLAEIDGLPVLVHVLRTASLFGPVIVVTGHDHEAVSALVDRDGLRHVHNPRHDDGMGTSIATGVSGSPGTGGWLVWPGDMPFIRPDSVRTVLENTTRDFPTIPTCDGRRGHPVYFPPSFAERLARLSGDAGARALTGGAVEIEVHDPGILRDIDTVQDLPPDRRVSRA